MNKLILVVLLYAVLQATYCSPVEYIQDSAFNKDKLLSLQEATGNTVEDAGTVDVNNKNEQENDDLVESSNYDDKMKERSRYPAYSGGQNIVEGDVILTPVQAAIFNESGWSRLVKSESWRQNHGVWPRFIPYTVDKSVGTNEQKALRFSISLFHQDTCLRFIEKTTERDYLNFMRGSPPNDGCASPVGKVGLGAQNVYLGINCDKAIPAHEILHSLGRWHEHVRSDRNNFVRMEWNNIPRDPNFRAANFNRKLNSDHQTVPYDYDSIMHYASNEFAINPAQATITPLQPLPAGVVLGQRDRLSKWDKQHVNIKYCPERVIRLVNSRSGGIHDGRVEVFWDGEWGTVCGAGFRRPQGRIICRYLGFPGVVRAQGGAFFGRGRGTIWFSNMQCQGNEPTPFHCPMDARGQNGCNHSQDAGVICQKNVRLVGPGSSATAGRVEVYINGQWGTICDDNFGREEAQVICSQLGLSFGNAQAVHRAYYGEGRLPILMDDLQCVGNEQQITHCRRRDDGGHNCQHSEDASVMCR